jgi:hypothetical protein
MAGLTGLEPATSSVTGWHSNRLSYNPNKAPDELRGGSETRICYISNCLYFVNEKRDAIFDDVLQNDAILAFGCAHGAFFRVNQAG